MAEETKGPGPITDAQIQERMQEILDSVRSLELQSGISRSTAIINVILARLAASELLTERFGLLVTGHLHEHEQKEKKPVGACIVCFRSFDDHTFEPGHAVAICPKPLPKEAPPGICMVCGRSLSEHSQGPLVCP